MMRRNAGPYMTIKKEKGEKRNMSRIEYELRVAYRGIQYRLLYFFGGRNATVISHGIVKDQRVPSTEINLAIQRKRNFEQNPGRHTYSLENDS